MTNLSDLAIDLCNYLLRLIGITRDKPDSRCAFIRTIRCVA